MAEATSADGPVRANITTDVQGWFKAVSPAFLELIGRPVEALAGLSLIDLVHPDDAAAARRLLATMGAAAAAAADTGAGTSLRIFTAGDTWRAMQATVRTLDEGRVVVDLAGPAPAAVPAPVSYRSPEPAQGSTATAVSAESHAADDSQFGFAGDDVPDRRAATRAAAGDGSTPMIEIDARGRTTFVSGPWSDLSRGATGADVFEELLEETSDADAILRSIASIDANSSQREFSIDVPGVGARWIQVRPIPSPHRSDGVHALVSVADGAGQAPAVSATSISPDAVAPHAVSPHAVSPESALADLAETKELADDSDDANDADDAESQSSRILWLAGVGLIVAALLAFAFGGDASEDATGQSGAISVELIATQPEQVTDRQSWRRLGAAGFVEIHGIATLPDGAYVASVDGQVLRLDDAGAATQAYAVQQDLDTSLSDIAANDAGTAWVLDAGGGRLHRLTPDGRVTQISTSDVLRNARGITAGANDTVWVASTASGQVTQLSFDGGLLQSLPLPGRQPSDVVEAPDGSLWIVDAQELELLHVLPDGQLVRAVPLDSFTSLESPHLALIGQDLWVSAPEQSSLVAFDTASGEPFGERIEITRPDGARVTKPIGIAASSDGRIWTVDSTGSAIVIVTP